MLPWDSDTTLLILINLIFVIKSPIAPLILSLCQCHSMLTLVPWYNMHTSKCSTTQKLRYWDAYLLGLHTLQLVEVLVLVVAVAVAVVQVSHPPTLVPGVHTGYKYKSTHEPVGRIRGLCKRHMSMHTAVLHLGTNVPAHLKPIRILCTRVPGMHTLPGNMDSCLGPTWIKHIIFIHASTNVPGNDQTSTSGNTSGCIRIQRRHRSISCYEYSMWGFSPRRTPKDPRQKDQRAPGCGLKFSVPHPRTHPETAED
jgi:hypothetical protein